MASEGKDAAESLRCDIKKLKRLKKSKAISKSHIFILFKDGNPLKAAYLSQEGVSLSVTIRIEDIHKATPFFNEGQAQEAASIINADYARPAEVVQAAIDSKEILLEWIEDSRGSYLGREGDSEKPDSEKPDSAR